MRISDWSSDVCSSDLLLGKEAIRTSMRLICPAMADTSKSIELVFFDIGEEVRLEGMQPDLVGTTRFGRIAIEIAVTSFCDERKQIGRESCRERVCQYV